MILLLDTHTLLWFLTNDVSFSARARNAIEIGPIQVATVMRKFLEAWERQNHGGTES